MSLTEEFTFSKEGNIEPTGLKGLIFLSLVIILVASLSFGIGRLSVAGRGEGIKIEYDTSLGVQQSASVINTTSNTLKVGEVVASSKGKKYHYPHCSGAKQITEANKITFASPEAAESSGYTLAANCSPR
jgi:hypothetical protein